MEPTVETLTLPGADAIGRSTWRISLRRQATPLLAAAVVVLLAGVTWSLLIAHVVDYSDGTSAELREDFVAFYAAGQLVRDGLADALYRPEVVASVERAILGRPAGRADDGLAYLNPPFVAGLFEPLSELSYGKAQAVWFGVSALTVAVSLALLWPELRKLRRSWALIFGIGALASFPVFRSLLYGQLSPLILLSWVLFYRLGTGGRDGPAGLALAASLIKPQVALVPVLYLVTTRRWRALLGFAAGAGVLAGVSAALAGPWTTFVRYPALLLHSLGWREEFGVNRLHMFGWSSFFASALPAGDAKLALLLTVVLSAATLLAAGLVWRQRRRLDAGSAPTLALATATILTSPHLHVHDLQILLLPAALLAAHRRDAAGILVPALLLFLLPVSALGPNLAAPLLATVLLVVLARALSLRLQPPPSLLRLVTTLRPSTTPASAAPLGQT